MVDYRVYVVDGEGQTRFAGWIKAASDEQAIEIARETKTGGRKCEVWQAKRHVASLEANGAPGYLPKPAG